MPKTVLFSIVAALAATGVALGQPPEQLPLPAKKVYEGQTAPPSSWQDVEILPAPTPSAAFGELPPAIDDAVCDPGEPVVFTGGNVRASYFTAKFEYLRWILQTKDEPFRLVTNDLDLFPVAIGGGNGTLPGQQKFESFAFSGGRISLGYWIADHDPVVYQHPLALGGVEFVGFALAKETEEFRLDTNPVLLRPFFDLNNRKLSGFLVAAPGVAAGTLFGSADAEFYGAEINAWKNAGSNAPGQFVRFDLMAGFRYLKLNTGINIQSQSVYDGDLAAFPELVPFEGNRIDVLDAFDTSNDFFGPQAGASIKFIGNHLIASANLKLAAGVNHQRVRIAGNQVRTFADGTVATSTGGVLALPSNIGTYRQNQFSLVPEAYLELAVPVNANLTVIVGYTFLGWTDVARAIEQIDPVVDISQIPNFPVGAAATGLGRPNVPFTDDFLFSHGLNVGFSLIW